jgi:hypothetical protein
MLRKFDADTKQQLTKKIRYVVDFEDWLEENEVFVLLQHPRPRSKKCNKTTNSALQALQLHPPSLYTCTHTYSHTNNAAPFLRDYASARGAPM